MLVDGSHKSINSNKESRDSEGSQVTFLDIEHPVDIMRPIERFCGNSRMYYGMLRRLEQMTLNQSMTKMANLINDKDYAEICNLSCMLKSACGYVGAGRLHYICFYIQDAIRNSKIQSIPTLYQQLVEESIAYKRYSRQILDEYSSIPHVEQESARSVDVADGFKIQHNAEDDRFYCLVEG